MVRTRNRLTSLAVTRLKEPGIYTDGGGLRLQITRGVHGDIRRSWVFRFRAPSGALREMGLGSVDDVGLGEARDAADAARKMVRDAVDPIEAKATARAAAAATVARTITFNQCVEKYLAANEQTWRNEKHRRQWRSTLQTYAYPAFGDMPGEGQF